MRFDGRESCPPKELLVRLSPRLDSRRLRELERPAGGGNGSLADEDLPGRGGLLETRAHVHRVPGDERAAFTGPTDDDIARVDPYAQREPIAELLPETALHPQRHM